MADFDVVLYGATGFTGRQAARYFAAHAAPGLRWAVAGRSASKLEALAAELDPAGVIVADSGDAAAVDAMVCRARVLLTTAGPFSKYGTPVVEACVRHGVHYVDITGETPWVRDLIDRFHDDAAARGTRIVPFCGFDSVPSDLGTLFVVDHLRRELGEETRRVSGSFRLRGGINGGTLDSAATMAERGERARVGDELLLNPPGHADADERARSRDLRSAVYDRDLRMWLAPFLMAPINTRVVRRSSALASEYGEPYGDPFTYREALEMSGRAGAVAMALASGAFDALVGQRWGRALVRRLGPAPGQGPSEQTMERGFFRGRFVGEAAGGRKVMATVSADGDPGNRVTVAILSEAAMLLTGDRADLPGGEARGGVLTPATALGLPLLERLRAAGFSATIEPLAA